MCCEWVHACVRARVRVRARAFVCVYPALKSDISQHRWNALAGGRAVVGSTSNQTRLCAGEVQLL